MLGAAPGGRKTYIAQHLSLALSQGTPFLDKFETEQCTVLYIDEENGIHLLHRRYGQLSEGHDIGTFDNLFLLVYEGIKLDVEEGKATMRVLVEHYKADYVIIDSMVRFMQGDENNASDVRNVFDNLKELMEERDMGFMILHHLGKDPRKGMMGLRGSSDFSGMCDVVLIMYERNGELVLEMDKNRVVDTSDMKGMGVAVTHPTGVKDEAVRFTYTGESVQRQEETLLDLAKEHIVRFLDKTDLEEFHVSAVLSHLSNKGVKKGTFYAVLRDFVADQVFHRKSRGVYTVDKNKFSTIKQKLVRVSQPTKSDKLEDSGVSQSVQGVSELTPDKLPDYTTSDQPYQTYIKNQKGGIADRTKIEKHYPNLDITKLIREGDLYEPKPGFIGVLE